MTGYRSEGERLILVCGGGDSPTPLTTINNCEFGDCRLHNEGDGAPPLAMMRTTFTP